MLSVLMILIAGSILAVAARDNRKSAAAIWTLTLGLAIIIYMNDH